MHRVFKSLLIIIVLFLLPASLFGEDKSKITPTIICPDNLQSALLSIKNNLNNKKWINIDIDACPNIQSEIIKNADKIVSSKEFNLYLGLMNLETMRLVRNTIFAIKGYKFEDDNLRRHFAHYEWYKPKDKKDVVLAEEENQRANLLKCIEEKWLVKRYRDDLDIPLQRLPNGVKVLQKDNKKLLQLGEKSLDITSETYGGGWGEKFFTVHGNNAQNAVLVCTQRRNGDSVWVEEMSLYSANGNMLSNFVNEKENRIGGLKQCPIWPSQRAGVLISYNNAGCCGAIWDILATFDSKLKPVAVLNCGESACGGTNLFNDLTEGKTYLSVAAAGSYAIDKNRSFIKYVNYNEGDTIDRAKYINTRAIWVVENSGDLKLAAEISEAVHDEPPTASEWKVVVDSPYPKVDLMLSSDTDARWVLHGQILISVKFGNILILYRAWPDHDHYSYGTTMIPLQ